MKSLDPNTAPFRRMPYLPPKMSVSYDESGKIEIASEHIVGKPDQSIAHLFKAQATQFPNRLWLAEKTVDGNWQKITYQEFDAQSDALAQWLLNAGYSNNHRIMVISENSIAHGLILMAAMKARVPSSSISAPYSLMDSSLTKLKQVTEHLAPDLVFAECEQRYAKAINYLSSQCRHLVVATKAQSCLPLAELLETKPTTEVDDSMAGIDADTIAKLMFTSGSTGKPKCVIQTQGALCAQVAGLRAISDPDYQSMHQHTSLQWMPWSHVSAGNIAYHEAIMHGGAIYIDDGKPIPGLFDRTLNNLRDIPTTVFGSAPIGLAWLTTALEADQELQTTFFSQLEAIAYGGSALPEDVALRLQRLAVHNTSYRIPIISMYGSTEAQGITASYWPTTIPGVIGLPMPGTRIRLIPQSGKLALTVKAPTMMQGYLSDTVNESTLFDEDGFFNMGDAVCFADPEDPLQGLVFDGRIAEDFKLLSGTWVNTSAVKTRLMAYLGNLVLNLLICGENRFHLIALTWLNESAVTKLLTDRNQLSPANNTANSSDVMAQATARETVWNDLTASLDKYNRQAKGTSERINSLIVMQAPPSMADGEINEKGYINTKVLQQSRAALIDGVYQLERSGVIYETELSLPSNTETVQ